MTQAVQIPMTSIVLEADDTGPWSTVWTYGAAGDVGVWIKLPGEAGYWVDSGDVTVTGAEPLVSGGSVEIAGDLVPEDDWPEGAMAYLIRTTPTGQTADIKNSGTVPLAAIEAALDRLSRQTQDARLEAARALRAPYGETLADLPGAADRAGNLLEFDAETGAVRADRGVVEITEAVAAGIGAEVVGLIAAAGASQRASVEATGQSERDLIELESEFQQGEIEDLAEGLMDDIEALGAGQQALVEGEGTAQLALIASAMGGDLYANTAAGIAALSVGDYFSTPGTNGAAINVYLIATGPVATLIAQLEMWQAKALRFFFGRARLDTAISAGLRPWVEPYRLRMYMGTLAGGAAKNANGAYTLPANATWTSPQLSAGVFDIAGDRFAYVPATTETTGAIQMRVFFGGVTIAAGNTTTEPSPGVYRQAWNNSVPRPYVQIEIKNVSAAAITIYPIEVYQTDASYFPQMLRFDASEIVTEDRPIIDWNEIGPYARWKRLALDRDLRALAESRINLAFDSVAGSDAAAGLPWTPKQNLTAGSALAAGQMLGLKRGAVWNQSVNTLIGSTTQGVSVCDYSAGRVFDPLPILDSGVDVTGLTWASEGSDTFSATVPCAIDTIKTGEQNYSYISVVEITLADEADKPRGCQRIMEPVNVILTGAVPAADQTTAINTVKATAGKTLGVFTPGNSTLTLYIHTRDGLAPDASATYGYRCTNLGSCMDWIQGNTRQAVVSGVEFRQGADGLGIVCGSNQSAFSRVIAGQGWKHTLHIEGGEVRDAVIWNRGAGSGANAGNCYVSPTANGHAWRWTYGMSFECNSAIYSHAAAGKYTGGEISYWWFIHDRESPTGSLCLGDPSATDQCDKSEEAWCYYQGYMTNGRSGTHVNLCITHHHHNLVRKTGRFVSRTLTENNIVQVENIGGAGLGDRNTRGCQLKENHVVRKNLIHITTVATGVADYNTQAVEIIATGNNNPDFSRNIVVLENNLGTSSVWVSEASAGLTWTSDYNLIILCVPGGFSSTKHGGGAKSTISEYLANFPGHDANSLFIDLRDDPRGARAIFLDPANGDYRWAQTPEAARAKAYCEANGVGPNCVIKAFPTIPTVDEACDALASA